MYSAWISLCELLAYSPGLIFILDFDWIQPFCYCFHSKEKQLPNNYSGLSYRASKGRIVKTYFQNVSNRIIIMCYDLWLGILNYDFESLGKMLTDLSWPRMKASTLSKSKVVLQQLPQSGSNESLNESLMILVYCRLPHFKSRHVITY